MVRLSAPPRFEKDVASAKAAGFEVGVILFANIAQWTGPEPVEPSGVGDKFYPRDEAALARLVLLRPRVNLDLPLPGPPEAYLGRLRGRLQALAASEQPGQERGCTGNSNRGLKIWMPS